MKAHERSRGDLDQGVADHLGEHVAVFGEATPGVSFVTLERETPTPMLHSPHLTMACVSYDGCKLDGYDVVWPDGERYPRSVNL